MGQFEFRYSTTCKFLPDFWVHGLDWEMFTMDQFLFGQYVIIRCESTQYRMILANDLLSL